MAENRRLPRLQEGRIVTGVCAGLGHYTRVDPVVFRVGFAVLTLSSGGSGIFLYIAAYLMMPPSEAGGAVAERLLKRRLDGDAVLTVLGAMLTAGVLISVLGSGFSGGGVATGPLTAVTLFALALLIAHARGVDLVRLARTLPERIQGTPYRPANRPPPPPPAPENMVDLATLNIPVDLATLERPAPATGGGAQSGTTRVLPTEPLPPGPPDDWSAPRPAPWSVPGARPPADEPCGGRAVTHLIYLAAFAAGALTVPYTPHQAVTSRVSIAIAVTLTVIGVGLIVASWYGRSRGMVFLGVVLCLALVSTSAAAELPQGSRWGDVAWRPVTAQADQSYKVAVGNGTIDLTALPLEPGQRVRVRAEVMLGALTVTVPGTVRTEVSARSALGDVSVDGKITSGSPGARVDTVLPAETPGAGPGPVTGKPIKNAPVIELHIRGRCCDVDVRRG